MVQPERQPERRGVMLKQCPVCLYPHQQRTECCRICEAKAFARELAVAAVVLVSAMIAMIAAWAVAS